MSESQFETTVMFNHMTRNRNSRPEVFCKKGVLKNFAKFSEKHLRQIY